MHSIAPVFDGRAKILILGSFPSRRSREEGFFYGHPQNRFWRVLAAVYRCEIPQDIEQKKAFLSVHGIALWDVIASCEITASADSSIRNVVVNPVTELLQGSMIHTVFLNGKTAEKYYRKYLQKSLNIPFVTLPSTSPANAAWSLERLVQAWECIRTEKGSI